MASAATATASRDPRDPARLASLQAQTRQRGEAKFFFYDSQFGCEAVKVLPGEYFVYDKDLLILTTLGSCIAVCLWDRHRRIGGLNHFMLPEGSAGDESGRFGGFAMELLINAMMKYGASRGSLEAKVFGGGRVVSGMDSMNVGERNAEFAFNYLKTERIPVVSKDVLDIYPRKICFLPVSGKAMVKRLASGNTESLLAQERTAVRQIAPASGGSVDLF